MHQVVLISGPPASGKSALAEPLAQALGFALLSKDAIKEALFDSLRATAGDEECSKRLSEAAMDVLFALAPHCPRVVLDANFRPHDARQRERLVTLGNTVVEVHCRCDSDMAMRRYAQRVKQLTPEMIARHDRPMGVGIVIEVDTNTPVDFPVLLRRVRQALAS